MHQSAIYVAATLGSVEQVVSAMGGATEKDLNWQDPIGWTPLHFACRHGHVECVSALVAAGANIEQVDSNGWMPLHHACSRLRVECARLLIDAGASADVPNRRGNTPLHLAQLASFVSDNPLLELLRSHGASEEKPPWLLPATEKEKKGPMG